VEILELKGKNDKETWKSILVHGGSILHLDFLSDHEKDVLKTFTELSQKAVVDHAAQRQPFIDQGQSINLDIPSGTSAKEINQLLIYAWEQEIKSLYYQRSSNPSQDLARSIMTCKSCEG
jgi:ribonucleoside-diphosphate reductase alpha chain